MMPSVGFRGDLERRGHSLRDGVKRVVAADLDFFRQALENSFAAMAHHRRLAMHRIRQHAELAAKCLDDALQTQANSEHRNACLRRVLHELRYAEVFGATGTRRDQDHVRVDRVEHLEWRSRAIRDYFRSRLARVIRQRVDEAIVVVDQQQLHLEQLVLFVSGLRNGLRAQQPEESGGFQPGFPFLGCRVGIVQQRRARRIGGVTIPQIRRANQDSRVDIAIERQQPDRAAVPAARVLFETLDGHGGGFFRRADQRHRPHVAEERIERIEAFLQKTFDMIHGMEQARVGFNQAASDHLDGAGLADAALVVAVDVGAHGELGLFFRRVEQRADIFFVLKRIAGAPRRAGDGTGFDALAFHPHKHLGRRAHQLLVCRTGSEIRRDSGWRAASARRDPTLCPSRPCGTSARGSLRSSRRAACLRGRSPRSPCILQACDRR